MKTDNRIGIVIIIAAIVAVIATLIVPSITGNVIKINQDAKGKYRVYTTSETYSRAGTDQRISTAITNLLNNVIDDEIMEPLEELRLIEHCDQYVQLGGKRSINLGGESYNIELINVDSSDSAKIKIGNVEKSVTKGQTYEFGEVSSGSLNGMIQGNLKVYIKGIQYEPNEDNAKIVMLEASNCKL